MVVPGLTVCGSPMKASRYAGFTREPTSESRGAFFERPAREGSAL